MDHNRNDGHNPKQILIQPNIGLDNDARQSIVKILNNTLANEAVLTQKTRSAYWNVSGPGFIELHILFDSQYKQLNTISDGLAERARMLGGAVIGSLQEFIKNTRLEEQLGAIPGILHLLADNEASIRYLREDAKRCTEEFEDDAPSNCWLALCGCTKRWPGCCVRTSSQSRIRMKTDRTASHCGSVLKFHPMKMVDLEEK